MGLLCVTANKPNAINTLINKRQSCCENHFFHQGDVSELICWTMRKDDFDWYVSHKLNAHKLLYSSEFRSLTNLNISHACAAYVVFCALD